MGSRNPKVQDLAKFNYSIRACCYVRRWLYTLSYPVEIHGTIVRYGLLLFCQGKKSKFSYEKVYYLLLFFLSQILACASHGILFPFAQSLLVF